MEPNALWSSLQTTLGAHLPSVFGALAILVVGWRAAVVLNLWAMWSDGRKKKKESAEVNDDAP